ncbi:MAG TPA: hypothetical protein VGY66_28345 [Gemmataceae bacterium]|jgi:flagellar motility protein MotE (MotC chaperone)|nr:hypothetical protein [Gemmataceae bacterium]
MKSFTSLSVVVLLAAAVVGVSFFASPNAIGQAQPKTDSLTVPVQVPDGQFRRPSPYLYGLANDKQHALQNESVQLAHQIAKAEDDDEKKGLRKKLTQVLDQIFDAHLKEQQKELDDLEKQVARLKKLLSKRREAKETIVERRLEQLVQDAEGLGWNAPNTPRGGIAYPGPSMTIMERKDALFPFAGKGDGDARKK